MSLTQSVEFIKEMAMRREEADVKRHERRALWVVILGLVPQRDGNQYCFTWGVFPEGVVGFGDTPYKAMLEFERAMNQALPKKT